MLQNTDATAECQHASDVPEVHSSSSVQPSSASESHGLQAVENTTPFAQPAPNSAVENGLLAFQRLTSIMTQVEEWLNDSAACHDSSLSTQSLFTEFPWSRVMHQLIELKNDTCVLTSAQQCTSGSDSGHDDCNSLPPEASEDVVGNNVDACVPQQPLTDALESSNEATALSLSTDSREADGFIEHVKSKARQIYCAIVRPCGTTAAANVPEFTAQGYLLP